MLKLNLKDRWKMTNYKTVKCCIILDPYSLCFSFDHISAIVLNILLNILLNKIITYL